MTWANIRKIAGVFVMIAMSSSVVSIVYQIARNIKRV